MKKLDWNCAGIKFGFDDPVTVKKNFLAGDLYFLGSRDQAIPHAPEIIYETKTV